MCVCVSYAYPSYDVVVAAAAAATVKTSKSRFGAIIIIGLLHMTWRVADSAVFRHEYTFAVSESVHIEHLYTITMQQTAIAHTIELSWILWSDAISLPVQQLNV